MAKQYTIELTDAEAVAVERMAAGRRKAPEQIVQHLVRTRLFDITVSMMTSEWTFSDATTSVMGPDPDAPANRIEEYTEILLDEPGGHGVKMH